VPHGHYHRGLGHSSLLLRCPGPRRRCVLDLDALDILSLACLLTPHTTSRPHPRLLQPLTSHTALCNLYLEGRRASIRAGCPNALHHAAAPPQHLWQHTSTKTPIPCCCDLPPLRGHLPCWRDVAKASPARQGRWLGQVLRGRRSGAVTTWHSFCRIIFVDSLTLRLTKHQFNSLGALPRRDNRYQMIKRAGRAKAPLAHFARAGTCMPAAHRAFSRLFAPTCARAPYSTLRLAPPVDIHPFAGGTTRMERTDVPADAENLLYLRAAQHPHPRTTTSPPCTAWPCTLCLRLFSPATNPTTTPPLF